MPKLIPPLPHLLVGRQEAVHRPLGAEVPSLVEQGGVDFSGSEVHEPWLVEHSKHSDLLFGAQRAG
jgi:hypothetical protein